MRIDRIINIKNNKTYTSILLRHAYRDENGKVRHKTLLNLTGYSRDEVAAIEFALKNKKNFEQVIDLLSCKITTRYSIGAIYQLYQIARETGVLQVLGHSQNGKIILWEVLSRLIQPTSKLGSVRLAKEHAVLEVFGMKSFNENHVYDALIWLNQHQIEFEQKLYKLRGEKSDELFLYDVTSSYFEGTDNEMAEFGYNRDKKSGKKQIVIGLLTDSEGIPVSIQVYQGNTQDVKTLSDQIEKSCFKFNVTNVVFVGDKGMIKTSGQKEIKSFQYNYITGITKPQIETMLKTGVFQMSLFDGDIHEITNEDGERYILRRNPIRQQEMEESRQDKLLTIKKLIDVTNKYLIEHKKAKEEVALKKIKQKASRLKISKWFAIQIEKRKITYNIKNEELEEEKKLDGCYVIKTNVQKTDAKIIHDRYKDLSKVEHAFKDCKTQTLEVRPIFLRDEERTRAHVFIVMLSYIINLKLEKYWQNFDMTVREGLQKLAKICVHQVEQNDIIQYIIPEPDDETQQLLLRTKTVLPKSIKLRKKDVYTTVKLHDRRKT